jgi:molybdopterin converting factor subunit 1
MHVRLRFFAILRERAGTAELTRELDGPTTVGELWGALRREHPALAGFRGAVAFAVNQEYVDSKTTLQDNDEVAFIPPVSGGSSTTSCLKSSNTQSSSTA